MSDQFEIAFSFDTTASMYSCLEEVRKRLREMVVELRDKIPGIKIAIFAHGDYNCHFDARANDYVTTHIDFTNNTDRLCYFISTVKRTHGFDRPECYELVLREVHEKLSWSPSAQKALIMIGDDEPHDVSFKGNTRRIDWREEIKRLRQRDITVYTVHCKNRWYSEYFYQELASRTFGEYCKLDDFSMVKDVLMGICFREAGVGDLAAPSIPVTPPVVVPVPSTSVEVSVIDDTSLVPSPTDSSSYLIGITCDKCKVHKPADEFPMAPITDECEHYAGCCYRCVVAYVREHGRCPQDECDIKVEKPNDIHRVDVFEATLDRMFLDYSKLLAESKKEAFGSMSVVTVSTMNGDTVWITRDSDVTNVKLRDVRKEVEKDLGFKAEQQKILYNDIVLKNDNMSLAGLGVTEGAALSLIVPLFCIPENLDHVVFDLSWQFPDKNPDFLDASCLAFNKTEFIQVIDWNHSNNQYFLKGSVTHNAKNETREGGRFGLQTLEVRLKRVPSTISHLYFTLSSWRAPNLSNFSNPSLRFYEKSEQDSNLCSTTFGHALNSQAVIMCSVVRSGSQWLIYECDSRACVDGNSKKYNPIRERIVELIKSE